jgi:hypothetical protein
LRVIFSENRFPLFGITRSGRAARLPRRQQEKAMGKTTTTAVAGAALALLALISTAEARKAGGTQQEYSQKQSGKASPILQGRTTR